MWFIVWAWAMVSFPDFWHCHSAGRIFSSVCISVGYWSYNVLLNKDNWCNGPILFPSFSHLRYNKLRLALNHVIWMSFPVKYSPPFSAWLLLWHIMPYSCNLHHERSIIFMNSSSISSHEHITCISCLGSKGIRISSCSSVCSSLSMWSSCHFLSVADMNFYTWIHSTATIIGQIWHQDEGPQIWFKIAWPPI